VVSIRNHLSRHWRFYISAVMGGAIWFAVAWLAVPARLVAAADAFFLAYLASAALVILRITPDELRRRAAIEDEGILLVILISLVVIAVSFVAIIIVMRQKHGMALLPLSLAISGVPLGWCTLHTIAAFRYADLYYALKDRRGPDSVRGLDFPHTKEPGIWDFLYYAFTVGMTAQTSDTNVLDARMRRATLGHSIVSFFYYTAIIAMSVNAAVNLGS
jgi:uncharacterized membrane protein